MFSSSEFHTDMNCHLKVDTQSPDWHRTINRVLRTIKGVNYSIDCEKGMAYITGRVNPNKLLKKIAKAGKHAELCWIQTGTQNIINPYGNGYHYYPAYYPQSQLQPYYSHRPYAYPNWSYG